MFLVLAGVAVMLGVMHGEFHWVLVVRPATALLVSVVAWSVARQQLPAKAFTELKAQIDADAQALRTSGRSAHERCRPDKLARSRLAIIEHIQRRERRDEKKETRRARERERG